MLDKTSDSRPGHPAHCGRSRLNGRALPVDRGGESNFCPDASMLVSVGTPAEAGPISAAVI